MVPFGFGKQAEFGLPMFLEICAGTEDFIAPRAGKMLPICFGSFGNELIGRVANPDDISIFPSYDELGEDFLCPLADLHL
jgi:hypothetical protein